jgi:TonB family protein
METLASAESASPETEPEVHLLLERDPKDDWHRWRSAAVVSAVVHLVLLIVLLLMPESVVRERVYRNPPVVHLTRLYIPTELTQKAPNKNKISKELTVPTITQRPVSTTPVVPKTSPKKAPPPAPPPPPQVVKNEPKAVIVDVPKIELPKSQADTQGDQLAKLNQLSPPPPPPQQPKLVLQDVAPPPPVGSPNQGKPLRGLAVPNPSVDAAVRELSANGGIPSGRQVVIDSGSDAANGLRLNLPPSVGQPRADIELRSDPLGVDFRPYLQQVVAAVRRNWFAVYPEAARLGQRGEVGLQFAIEKRGSVAKIVFEGQSGSRPLDESAVAAISASNPLPPLPAGFKGDRVVLRLTFKYNMPR